MTGVERIAAERDRQVDVKGRTPEHDDEHRWGQLTQAASCYLWAATQINASHAEAPSNWPWDLTCSWRPSDDPKRNLEKAGALIAAEIDRIQRLEDHLLEGLVG